MVQVNNLLIVVIVGSQLRVSSAKWFLLPTPMPFLHFDD